MKEIIKSLMTQGYLTEQSAAELIKEASLKEENFSKILLSLNPPKVITREFIVKNNLEILKRLKATNPNLDEQTISFLINLAPKEKEATKEEIESQNEKRVNEKILDELRQRKFEVVQAVEIKNRKLGVEDFTKYFKGRYEQLKRILQEKNLENLSSIGKLSNQRKNFSIIGMVSNKRITKNKNILLEMEDLTGKLTVLINANKKEVFEKAKDVVLDEVIGLTGTGDSEIFFVNDIFFPDTFITEKKNSPEDAYIAFTADWHVGHNKFMEDNVLKFISWINGELGTESQKEMAKKVNYMFVVGDLIEGVGVYPSQEHELSIKDIYAQYEKFTELLQKIRKDVTIIICPGNHDAVRLVEPQPTIERRFLGKLPEMENVFLTTNPSVVNLGKTKSFSGFNVLMYHGFSFTHYMDDVDSLRLANSKMKPDMIMHFLLKRRHLAPTHTSTTYFPYEKDFLMIENAPDIFVSAHTHHTAISTYNNIVTISCAAWIPKTTYQEKLGLEVDPCKVPLFHMKTGKIAMLDFS